MSSGPERPPSAAVESPPSGGSRPRREGNDSLWKRARRTLGTQNLGFLQQTAKQPGASATTSGPAAPKTRREQVRHAQRTHRQRTQNYIKTLESEVVRLRESEGRLMTERDDLRNSVRILKTTLVSANLPLPPGIDDEEPTSAPPAPSQFDMPATVSCFQDDLDHERLHISWAEPTNQPLAYASPQHQYGALPAYNGPQNQAQRPLPDFPNDLSFDRLAVSEGQIRPVPISKDDTDAYAPPATDKRRAIVGGLDTAVEFVLALEHPCMSHIPHPTDDTGGQDPTDHIMLLSTPLVSYAPRSPKTNPNTSWTASGTIIKELLNLSQGINLEGEITPVEAWQRLHSHPEFWRLDKEGVENLKRALSAHVRCCGFGAVLDEAVFWHYLNQELLATNNQELRRL